jgi:hypothetical protein
MSYPVTFEMDYIQRRSRVTTFFRIILTIPHLFFLFFYAIGFIVGYVIAWFALMFTARWPESLYGFMGGFVR